jgi:transposase
LAELALPTTVAASLTPLVTLLQLLDEQIAAADAQVAAHVRRDPLIRRLATVPGVGAVTATAFVATLDRVQRFEGPQQVTSYLGLISREYSLGEQQHRGPIAKAGNTRMRRLLVEAAWTVLRWAEVVTRRRGKPIAAVAVARRLARILYALWRDGTTYDPTQVGRRQRHAAA